MKRKVLIDDCVYALEKKPKYHVRSCGDVYSCYRKPSYEKLRAYNLNYKWYMRCDTDKSCMWYGVQSHNCQHFSIAFSCLAEDLETHEIIRVMVYNTGMNVYVWKIADNLVE